MAVRAAGVELHGQLGASAAFPRDLHGSLSLLGVDGHDDLVDQCAQQLLAVAIGRRVRRPEAREVTRDVCEREPLLVGERLWAGVLEPDQLAALALDCGERVFELALQRASDEPVLWLARVELSLCPLGLILSSLQRQALTGQQLPRADPRARGSRRRSRPPRLA